MAETSVCSTRVDAEVSELKEALYAQHQKMQELYVELEEEREASATAVNEAMSMILRLQGEKAAEKMAAHQYKRMEEEKMQHAEATLAIFEEILYRKDMEIASLEFQLQAVRHKLLSIGFSDLNIGEVHLLGNLLCKNGACSDDISISGKVRRNSSLPVQQLKPLKSTESIVLTEEPSLRHLTTRKIEEDIAHEFDYHCETGFRDQLNEKADHAMKHGKTLEEYAVEDFSSSLKRIARTGEQMEELSQSKNIEGIATEDISLGKQYQPTCSVSSAASSNTSYNSRRGGGMGTRLDSHGVFSCSAFQTEDLKEVDVYHRKCMETAIVGSSLHSTSIHDIFEVPQNQDGDELCEHQKLVAQKEIFEDESWPEKPDTMLQGTGEYNVENENQSPEKSLLLPHHKCKWSTPGNRETIHCHRSLIDHKPCFHLSEPEVLQIYKRLQLLEDDRRIMKEESSQIKKEELKLLKQMHERLKTIESKIMRPKAEKNSAVDESIMVCLMEAMLCFSL